MKQPRVVFDIVINQLSLFWPRDDILETAAVYRYSASMRVVEECEADSTVVVIRFVAPGSTHTSSVADAEAATPRAPTCAYLSWNL